MNEEFEYNLSLLKHGGGGGGGDCWIKTTDQYEAGRAYTGTNKLCLCCEYSGLVRSSDYLMLTAELYLGGEFCLAVHLI